MASRAVISRLGWMSESLCFKKHRFWDLPSVILTQLVDLGQGTVDLLLKSFQVVLWELDLL